MIRISSPIFGREERMAVDAVLRSGSVVQGAQVAAFEQEFTDLATKGCQGVAVNSGTSALHLGLLASGIGPGDEVIVPAFTFAATANAVALTGATPVFADVSEDDFGLDPNSVRSRIAARTRAIIVVHLYGQIGSLGEILRLAKSHGLLVVEDAAQAHLASMHGQQAGTIGHFGAFSFYPTKNMTTGEGGIVTSRDESFLTRVRLLRNQGQEERYKNLIPGFNNRMTDIAGAIGRVQLKSLVTRTLKRRRNASFYDEALAHLSTPSSVPHHFHVYHQYTLKFPASERNRIRQDLHSAGIETQVYYPIPVHRLDAYDLHDHLPVAQELAERVLSIPVHPGLSGRDLQTVASAIQQVAEHEP